MQSTNLDKGANTKMSCKDCDKMDEENKVYYFRFGTANIGIIACEEHFKQVREKLLGV